MRTRTPKQPLNPGPECSQFAALLPLLDAGELAPEEAAATRAHLSNCRWCQRQLGEYGTVERALRQHLAALEAAFPAFSAQEVIAMVEQESATASSSAPMQPARRPHRASRFLAWAGPLAAVLVIALLTVSVFSLRSHPTTTSTTTPAIYANVNGVIVALRQSDGKLLWRSQSGFSGQPISDHGIVYAKLNRSIGAALVALRASDGKVLWQNSADVPPDPIITAANGIVYLVSGPKAPQSNYPGIFALRGSDGTPLWRHFATPADVVNPVFPDGFVRYASAPLISGNTLYIGLEDSLLALQTSTGQKLWAVSLKLAISWKEANGATVYVTSPSNEWLAADSTSVYVYTNTPHQQAPGSAIINGTFAQVFALRASDGAQLWNRGLIIEQGTALQDSSAPLVAFNGVIYVSAIERSGESSIVLFGLRASDGTPFESTTLPVDLAGTHTATGPVFANNALYFGRSDGSLLVVHLDTHVTDLWRKLPDNQVGIFLILGANNGAVFAETADSILAFNVTNGHLLWQQAADNLK